mmetsp:Transcript_6600/g.19991  ORF Transcript_6600/g.19991 Transcript_6600/m.19991 type:complete len:231 (+) Transcript_6600:84-776(+)
MADGGMLDINDEVDKHGEVDVDVGVGHAEEHAEEHAEMMMVKPDDKDKDRDKDGEHKKGAMPQQAERQLMPSVSAVPIMPAVMAGDGTALAVGDPSMGMQKGMNMGAYGNQKMLMAEDEQRKGGKRRRIYQTDEERRMARILKNRRTAEESRQRRVQRMKELEADNANAQEREKNLRWELQELREELSQRISEVSRLSEENEKLRRENDVLKGDAPDGADRAVDDPSAET